MTPVTLSRHVTHMKRGPSRTFQGDLPQLKGEGIPFVSSNPTNLQFGDVT